VDVADSQSTYVNLNMFGTHTIQRTIKWVKTNTNV